MSAIAPIASLLGAIPYLGTLAHVAWGTVLMIIASVEVHGLKERSAQIVFGIIGAIMALLGVSNEFAARNLQQHFDQMSRQLGEDLSNKTPEELGQSVGEFLKGIESATRQAEQASQ
jgi:ABC-type sulfate transport system permease component